MGGRAETRAIRVDLVLNGRMQDRGWTRRDVLAGGMAFALSACASAPVVSPIPRVRNARPGAPNLLFVFSDQHSSDMLGCYGNPMVQTPNIDQLAREGVRFTSCVSNAPVCTPYRGMLMSGMHPLWNGAFTNDVQMLPGQGQYLGEILRDAGYRTGWVGKWHLYGGFRRRPIPQGELRYGFDDYFLTNNVHSDFRPNQAYYFDDDGKEVRFTEWEPYGQTKLAQKFLEEQPPDQPFALFLSLHPPHNHHGRGYPAPKRLLDLYDPAAIPIRENVEDTSEIRGLYQGYMALTTCVDECVGMLLETLKQRGLDKNTLVVFTSDHGDLLRSHGFPGPKGRPEQESVKVPLIARFPGRLEPRTSELLVGAIDLMPTLLGLLELPIPTGVHGRNLQPAIIAKDDKAVDAQFLMMIHGRGWRGVYTPEFTFSFETDERDNPLTFNRLYDRSDRWQSTNLYFDPGYQDKRQQLRELTQTWLDRFQDGFVPYNALARLCLKRPDLPLNHRAQTGELKGRPVDLARGFVPRGQKKKKSEVG